MDLINTYMQISRNSNRKKVSCLLANLKVGSCKANVDLSNTILSTRELNLNKVTETIN